MKLLFKKATLVLTVLSILFISSCDPISDDDLMKAAFANKEYNITFIYGDGREDEILKVKSGETAAITLPKREGYEFVGWCTDEKLTNFVDFSNPITKDMTLYAKWNTDYKALLANVSANASKLCVTITSSNGMLSSSQGSGVIYKNDTYNCYVLTNSHVITMDSGYVKTYNTVTDVYGNEYKATVVKNSPEHDLAVLKFSSKEAWTFGYAEIDNRIPDENERIVMVSTPKGKVNTVELGDVAWYSAVESQSALDFEVIWIDGNADNGSSGGAVFDKDLNVVGIMYATVKDKENDRSFVLAIPAEKVLEFLSDIQYQ